MRDINFRMNKKGELILQVSREVFADPNDCTDLRMVTEYHDAKIEDLKSVYKVLEKGEIK